MAIRQETVHQGSVADLITQLTGLEAQDAVRDAERSQAGGRSCLFFFLAVLGIILGLMFSQANPLVGRIVALLGLAALVGGVIQAMRYSRLKVDDLDGDRFRMVREFLEMLQPDISDKAPVSLTLKHGDATEHAPATHQKSEGSMLTGKVNYAEYQDEWLSLRARLEDGCTLRLSVTRTVKRKSKAKRKYTKVNDRVQEQVKVALRVPAEYYPGLARLQQSLPGDKLGGQARMQLTGLRIFSGNIQAAATTFPWSSTAGRSGRSEANEENKLTADKLVSLMAYLYAGLNRCRWQQEP